MDYNFKQPEFKPLSKKDRASHNFANASVVFGAFSLFSLALVTPALVSAPLGVMFALLSKRRNQPLSLRAKIGFALCVICYLIIVVSIVSSIIYYSNKYGSFQNFYKQYIEELEKNVNINSTQALMSAVSFDSVL
ncbi:hypothetical protein SAMN05216249_10347 [Acetitomaculum ruminis DSM 5522]|uniref:DUF4190 domain-containing protein n=1 Tax=Acetitomaculum ruminis DSM 5522 TaxID=1120918 RepID=A0A1I0W476_9FIRM|nr:hypothetical protein [Acetitomaculum ruminis]SFA83030.1 hypothetical protein SAMN05216249_10347 [Acetitomaculum ruminis DSM 5522]